MPISGDCRDRAIGSVVGSAIGDALGAGYEFAPVEPRLIPYMKGGGLGNFAPGEWTDDTTMALGILLALAQHGFTLAALDSMGPYWLRWLHSDPADIGIHTRMVLEHVPEPPTAQHLMAASQAMHKRNGQSGGNGSLMRIAPVGATSILISESKTVKFAKLSSSLTHWDPNAGIAAALWALAIRDTVLSGELPSDWMGYLPRVCETKEQLTEWKSYIDTALSKHPNFFSPNGYTVTALQAAIAVVEDVRELPPENLFAEGLYRIIRIGDDTDTTAAILGGLLGAWAGYEELPEEWVAKLHGWPRKDASDLKKLTELTLARA